MQRSCLILFFSLIFCGFASSQDRGFVECGAGNFQIIAWTAPGSASVVDYLACGQQVKIIALEEGYYKIQLGDRIGYVYARFVKLSQSQEQRKPQPEKRTAKPSQPSQPPPPTKPIPQAVDIRKTGSYERESPFRQRIGFGGWVSPALPLQESQKGGIAYGANFEYRLFKPLVFEMRAWSMNSNFRTDSRGLSAGTLSTAAGQVSLFYRLNLRTRWAVNLGGGGGYYFVQKFDLDSGLAQSWNNLGFTLEEKLDSAPGYHVGGNMDFRLTKHFGINLDARYCRITSKGSWSQKDQISGETTSGTFDHVRLDMILAAVGFKFSF